MEKKTPLYDIHVKLGGKMTPFADYLLPLYYETGIIKEHNTVRTGAGLFDASHMGEFILEGADAAAFADYIVTNNIANLPVGTARYSPMCNENGGVVDDLLIYRLSLDRLMLVVNASNREKDFDWIRRHLWDNVKLTDVSGATGLIALQGRNAVNILNKLTDEKNIPKKSYTFTPDVLIAGKRALVSRTGYTGEDGFEFYAAWDDTPAVFEAVLEAGGEYGIIPCGLGARDTLRLEACMPLYGHEMDEGVTPIEAELVRFVKFDKPDFIGKKAIWDQGIPERKRIGLELTEKGIAREHCPVLADGKIIGEVTSGTLSPYTQKAIAMALINIRLPTVAEIKIDVRGRLLAAKVVPMPFYKKNY